jgi:HAD-superfamily hydrolase, subfamily IIB
MTRKTLLLFDIDGTLTKSRQKMTNNMRNFLINYKKENNVEYAIVSGSDFNKACEQIGEDIFDLFSYVFPENGLVYYKNSVLIHKKSLRTYFTQSQINKFINRSLQLIADIDIPIKTGTFIEYRNGMINISPIGRQCSQQERDDFEKLDKINLYRKKMIETLQNEFSDMNIKYSIGGQISFDVFPEGTDKRYCLQYLESENFKEIHFFGDKTDIGGNDYEIYNDKRIIPHKVISYQDTIDQLKELQIKLNN